MRKKLFKWHSIGALIAILPVIVISVTGSILVFKSEIDTWLMPEAMTVNINQAQQRLSLDALIAKVKNEHPKYEVGTWEIFDKVFDNKVRSDTAYLIERSTNTWAKVYLNQYTGEMLSTPVGTSDDLTDWLLDLHYKFLLETKGMFIGAIVSLILLFLGISGIILYRNFWLNFFTLRIKLAARIFFSDLHKMVGISSSPVLLILAFTGAYWNILLVVHEITEHVIEEPYKMTAPLHNAELSIQTLYEQSKNEIDSFTPNYLVLPFEPSLDITFYGAVESSNPINSEYANFVTFDKISGKSILTQDIRTSHVLTVIDDSFRKLHFGYFAGLTSKIIWCVLGFSPIILAFTGLYLYWFRKRKKFTKPSKTRQTKINKPS